MLQRIKEFILQHNMILPEDHLILGVSGGADSVCLLKVIMQLKLTGEISGAWDFEIFHVEHGIRGEESRLDAGFVEKLAHQLNVPFNMVSVDVPSYARNNGLGDEEAARILRYDAFYNRAKGVNGKLVLAHHQEDNAETVLFQMLRGSALKGLTGISPIREDKGIIYIRPLLCVSRKEIERYLADSGTEYRTDSTNLEVEYSRNRLRNIVFPELEEINSKAVAHINRSAQYLREVWEFLSAEVDKAYEQLIIADTKEKRALVIQVDKLKMLPKAVSMELVLRVVSEVAGHRKDIGNVHVEAVLGLMDCQSGRELSLPYGVLARREFDTIRISRKAETVLQKEIVISQQQLQQCKELFSVDLGEGEALLIKCFNFDGDKEKIPKKPYTKWFDYDKIKSGFQVRKRQPGDYFINDINGHKKKLKEYFIDEKIPVSSRDNRWLLADESHVIWIIGGRISEAYKVSDGTRAVVEVEHIGGK